jgi:integrase/recombinase XerD
VFVYTIRTRLKERKKYGPSKGKTVLADLFLLKVRALADFQVPMPDRSTECCREFSKRVHSCAPAENYYFPALGGKPITIGNLYHNFRRFLWRAKISHGGKGRGPRIHDFRHSYAVHCLKKWAEEDKDLTAYLPVLKAYMGHDSFIETSYYLRLTRDAFPHIILKIEAGYPEMIPQLEGDINEIY